MTLTLRQPRSIQSFMTPTRFEKQTIKVLLVVDDCDPFGSTEGRDSYQLARALARNERLEITLATHESNRESFQSRPMDTGRGQTVEPRFIDSPRVRARKRRLGTVFQAFDNPENTTEHYDSDASNLALERAVHKRLKSELSRGSFDVVHCLSSHSSTVTSLIPLSPGTPTLFGPVANCQFKQSSVYDETPTLERLLEWVPTLRGGRCPGLTGIIAASRETLEELPENGPRPFYLPNAQSEPECFPMIRSWRPPTPTVTADGDFVAQFRFVTAGPLVPGMHIDWVIRAMGASTILRNSHLTVIGEGPELANLKALAGELGLRSNIEFLGWADDQATQECLRKSQAFVFPSGTELDGGLIVEAMSAGLPVIVRDLGEPREIVDHSTGIRLPLDHAEGLMKSVQQTMERLATDYRLCERLGKAGSKRARERFSWATKAAMIVRFYESLIESRLASDGF